ncbi:hypothetical protein [Paenibacillus thermotolerans]|uniref:hypothetical protein n=1 Tax=Paenibacillus thermotolerans TaxID=3027807 RepID=UPI002367C55A|nr:MULTISPECIES: hypothetical protein [unclassified Paenibacillus]
MPGFGLRIDQLKKASLGRCNGTLFRCTLPHRMTDHRERNFIPKQQQPLTYQA